MYCTAKSTRSNARGSADARRWTLASEEKTADRCTKMTPASCNIHTRKDTRYDPIFVCVNIPRLTFSILTLHVFWHARVTSFATKSTIDIRALSMECESVLLVNGIVTVICIARPGALSFRTAAETRTCRTQSAQSRHQNTAGRQSILISYCRTLLSHVLYSTWPFYNVCLLLCMCDDETHIFASLLSEDRGRNRAITGRKTRKVCKTSSVSWTIESGKKSH